MYYVCGIAFPSGAIDRNDVFLKTWADRLDYNNADLQSFNDDANFYMIGESKSSVAINV